MTLKSTLVLLLLAASATLGAAPALAICGDTQVSCWGPHPTTGEHNVFAGKITVDACYNAGNMSCSPCVAMCSLKAVCNTTYPASCAGKCWTWWHGSKSGVSRWCRGDSGWEPPY